MSAADRRALQKILRNHIEVAPPAAHAIGIGRRGLRRQPDDHQFGLRVDVDPLAVNAERAEHALGSVDAIPFAAIAGLREDVGELRTRPRLDFLAGAPRAAPESRSLFSEP